VPVLTETTDALNTASTTYMMGARDYFFGSLGSSDSDWIEVTLEAGQTYTFAMVGVGATTDSLSDPYLRLRDSAGSEIVFDDDGGPGVNSAITFTATTSGTHYIDAQSYNGASTGDYGLSMTTGTRASYDVTMGAGNLIRTNLSWSANPGTPTTVTWSIRDFGTEPDGGNSFVAPSAAQIAAIEEVMGYFEGVSGLTLSQVAPGGTSNDATMVFGTYSANDGSGAYAYLPGNASVEANAGDVWLNNNSGSTTSLPMGSYSYFVLLHEIGHAIGLSHPGDYNAALGVSITYANNAQFTQDSHQYTLMSYFDEGNTASTMNSYPDTLMLYDLLALHQLYGADMTYNAGNTTYGFNATVGGAYDFTTNLDPFLSIWDGGGTDTLDLSGYTFNQVITLEADAFSDVGGYIGNLSIAIGAVIENAIGGSGNDEISGNAVNNSLSGEAGGDILYGEGGNDTLLGGAGNDTLHGGDQNDSLVGGIQEDALYGGDGNDTLFGNAGFDTLRGGAGDDLMDGGAQADNLFGGTGDDTMLGGGGFDRLFGQTGDDVLYGGDTYDSLFGQEDNDQLYGQTGNDVLWGGQGNDLLDGGADDDLLIGGAGFDTLLGSTGNDTLTGAFNADTFIFTDFGGGFGNDVITDFDANNSLENIDLSRVSGIADFNDLVANHMTQIGANVVIDDGSSNTITLQNVLLTDLLDGTDFIF
jgi:serralysin